MPRFARGPIMSASAMSGIHGSPGFYNLSCRDSPIAIDGDVFLRHGFHCGMTALVSGHGTVECFDKIGFFVASRRIAKMRADQGCILKLSR
jgi:hypothetical protein